MARKRKTAWIPDYDPTGRYTPPEPPSWVSPPAPENEKEEEKQEPKEEEKQEPAIVLDWKAWLENWGFDTGIISELDRIFRGDADPGRAAANALAYIRGTDWYAKVFAGINEAKRHGLVRDERDYRAFLNQSNQVYKQYLGRDITTAEFEAQLREGVNPDIVGRRFEGEAYIKANEGDIQYLAGAFGEGRLNQEQLTSFGRQQAGLSSMMGAGLVSQVQRAQERVRRIFEGTLATPSLSIGSRGLQATSLGESGSPDIGR